MADARQIVSLGYQSIDFAIWKADEKGGTVLSDDAAPYLDAPDSSPPDIDIELPTKWDQITKTNKAIVLGFLKKAAESGLVLETDYVLNRDHAHVVAFWRASEPADIVPSGCKALTLPSFPDLRYREGEPIEQLVPTLIPHPDTDERTAKLDARAAAMVAAYVMHCERVPSLYANGHHPLCVFCGVEQSVNTNIRRIVDRVAKEPRAVNLVFPQCSREKCMRKYEKIRDPLSLELFRTLAGVEDPTAGVEDNFVASKNCAYCGIMASRKQLKKCGRCGKTAYCGRECQAEHWSIHASFCVPKADKAGSKAKLTSVDVVDDAEQALKKLTVN